MLFSLLLPSAALAGWLQLGPADGDGDGVPDRADRCPTIAEIENGYADDDGCPDFLSFVTVQATYGGRRLPFAEYWMRHAGRSYVANGSAMSLEDLVPGAEVEVAARHACLGAEGTVHAGPDPVGIRLALRPEKHTTVAVHVRDEQGRPVDAHLVWTSSAPSACGPDLARTELPEGEGSTVLGLGKHTWMVRSRGRVQEGVLEVSEPIERVDLAVVLPTKKLATSRRLEPIVYFASGRSTLDEAAKTAVAALAAQLREQPALRVTLEGHADTRASSLYNQDLGARRAAAVRDALLAAGIEPGRLDTKSQGESEPAEAGYSESAHAMNRRVEAVVRSSAP
ncbi:MAG: OmpA family protein [Myxococcales bacterium]|nr:OmpA family protein [Myxococcales bacterium]MCB9672556.1 OmpA family protein [Alphaproteobacteria bacterium]